MSNHIYLDELTATFEEWCSDIAHTEDYSMVDAVNWKLITELCEKNVIESYSWDFKNGLVFEMRKGWKDASIY